MSLVGNKDFTLRIFKSDGTFIKTINLFSWTAIKFQINGGCGQFDFSLPNRFDDYGEGSTVYYNNRVELWCTDSDTQPLENLIYSGYINTFGSKITGQVQSVNVTCLGYVTFLKRTLLSDGTNIIYSTATAGLQAGTSTATGAMALTDVAKAAIDLVRLYQPNTPINYTAASQDSLGASVTYTFNKVMVFDVMNILKDNAPAGAYWYVGADNVFQFRLRPTTPAHTFVFGKHFNEVDILNTSDQVANNIVVETNVVLEKGHKSVDYYRNTASEAIYGRLWNFKSNTQLVNQGDIDAFGNQVLNSVSTGSRKITITILDNQVAEAVGLQGYPIEKIRPGDTIKFRGFNDITSADFPDNLQVVGIERSPQMVRIELEQLQDSIARQVAKSIYFSEKSQGEMNKTPVPKLNTRQAGGGNDRVRCRADGTQAISTNTTVNVLWAVEDYNTNALHSTSTNSHIITANIAGTYALAGMVGFTTSESTGTAELQLLHNGSEIVDIDSKPHNTVTPMRLHISAHFYLAAGDTVQLTMFQNSGNTKIFSNLSHFAIHLHR